MAADRAAVEAETVAQLQALIRFDTTNPPGNELPLAQYLSTVLEGAGIPTKLLVPLPGRAAVIARLPGTGRRRPVMLLAHMDVVGVERDKWSCDPFGGVVRDGYVYGRGAIDDKGMLAANLMAML
ncbi:MAG TPA: M20/M25/M40 family metallo-hydrolase, partial [Gemmatimonadaceae bacterium]|nr:M20/M25/M40 family metallo-hydrolase [Gemmatimonadaceae bacterium]